MKNTKALILVLFMALTTINAQEMQNKLSLMPWPKNVSENTAKFYINSDVTISVFGEDQGRVRNAAVNFLRRLTNRTGIFLKNGFPSFNDDSANIKVYFSSIANLSIDDDESYTLEVLENSIIINANTDVGALRGIQTLLQLTSYDNSGYFFNGVSINDAPRFVWRGLMIDVARHFQPVEVLKRNLDAMASVKMNVFHWHLTDDQGFRVKSKSFPKLHEIGGDGFYYTHSQIKEVVEYASNLGIRVIPEFDVPGHATAILAAYPEYGSVKDTTYTVERNAGIFNPTLDPTNDKTYEFLDTLFTEIAPLFPDEYFHIGGDENEGKHWDANPEIQKFKKKHNLKTNHDLQTYFNIKLEKILNRLGKKLMGWDEIMTPNMPTTAVIHSWRGENEGFSKGGTLIDAAKNGYNTVLSAGFYIDRMLSIEHHYSVEPIGDVSLTTEERKRILGGETTMWSELVTPTTIDSRIWPRTAAIAERFWSPKEINDIENMRLRLEVVNFRLEELGLTHIKNRDVILRSMTNNNDISALKSLSNVCEPLKVYSRNAGGTEYQTYSPFTLFADACVADAKDAVAFNSLVSNFINDNKDKENVLNYLNLWAKNYGSFSKIENNPNVKPLKDLSKNLSEVSEKLANVISKETLDSKTLTSIQENIAVLKAPFMDVELAILDELESLISYCKSNYLTN
ncbi:beta-N-acetylhexosaminidase [Pontimicrobium sp. IMCC45349]|uniref:beta-N-acetylhexosaminidase n=1 Tax=Pontimicrobium sp. IMCC45349 TaxID=3391574 RepID=UPI0039A38B68